MPKPFQYFEVRPILRDPDDPTAFYVFTEQADFDRAKATLRDEGSPVVSFWSIYGIDADGEATAIEDSPQKMQAHELLDALLAPLRATREKLVDPDPLIDDADRIGRAVALIDALIENCSTRERI